MRRRLIFAQSPAWAALAAHADALVAGPDFRAVKDEAKTRAGFLSDPAAGEFFVKRYDSGSFADGLWERLRGSRAHRSIRGAAALAAAGMRRPAPLAALEVLTWGAIRASYLLSQALTDGATFSQFVDRGRDPRRRDPHWRRRTFAAVATEVRRLHDSGLYSSDLQETNLFLKGAAPLPEIYFVDLDGFRRFASVSWKRRIRNLVELDRSIGRFMSRTERLRFLYAYLGVRPSRDQCRRLVSRILKHRMRKERQYERRRARRAANSAVARSARADAAALRG